VLPAWCLASVLCIRCEGFVRIWARKFAQRKLNHRFKEQRGTVAENSRGIREGLERGHLGRDYAQCPLSNPSRIGKVPFSHMTQRAWPARAPEHKTACCDVASVREENSLLFRRKLKKNIKRIFFQS